MECQSQFSDTIVSIGVDKAADCNIPISRPLSLNQYEDRHLSFATYKYVGLYKNGHFNQYNYKLNCVVYLKGFDLFIGITQGIPNFNLFSNTMGLPQIYIDYKVDMPRVDNLLFFEGKLCVIGTCLDVYEISANRVFDIDQCPIKLNKLFRYEFSVVKSAPFIFFDNNYNRFIVVMHQGFTVITLDGTVIYDNYNISLNQIRSASVFLDKPKSFVNSTAQREPFTKLVFLTSDGSIQFINRSVQKYLTLELPGVFFSFVDFISKQFIILLSHSNEIYICDIKAGLFTKVYELKEKPDYVEYRQDLKQLSLLFNTKLMIFNVKTPWILWKSFTSDIKSIKYQISTQTYPKICLLHDNLFITLVNPDTVKEILSFGLTGTSQARSFIYDRGAVDENTAIYNTRNDDLTDFETLIEDIYILRDNCTTERYESIDEKEFIQKDKFPTTTVSVCIGKYNDNPCLFAYSKSRDILVYDIEKFEQLNRKKLDIPDVITMHYHYGTNRLFLATPNKLYIIDPDNMKINQEVVAKNLYMVEFEGSSMMAINDEKVQLFNIEKSLDLKVEFPVYEKIVGSSIYKDSFACYTSSNLIIFGKQGQNIGRIKSPWKISSIFLLNSKFDILIAIGRHVMIFHALDYYPYLYQQMPMSLSRRGQRLANKMSRKSKRKSLKDEQNPVLSYENRNEILNEIYQAEEKGIKKRNKEKMNDKDYLLQRKLKEEERLRKEHEEKVRMNKSSRHHLKGILRHIMSTTGIPKIDATEKAQISPSKSQPSPFKFVPEMNSNTSLGDSIICENAEESHEISEPTIPGSNSPRFPKVVAFAKTVNTEETDTHQEAANEALQSPRTVVHKTKLSELIGSPKSSQNNSPAKETTNESVFSPAKVVDHSSDFITTQDKFVSPEKSDNKNDNKSSTDKSDKNRLSPTKTSSIGKSNEDSPSKESKAERKKNVIENNDEISDEQKSNNIESNVNSPRNKKNSTNSSPEKSNDMLDIAVNIYKTRQSALSRDSSIDTLNSPRSQNSVSLSFPETALDSPLKPNNAVNQVINTKNESINSSDNEMKNNTDKNNDNFQNSNNKETENSSSKNTSTKEEQKPRKNNIPAPTKKSTKKHSNRSAKSSTKDLSQVMNSAETNEAEETEKQIIQPNNEMTSNKIELSNVQDVQTQGSKNNETHPQLNSSNQNELNDQQNHQNKSQNNTQIIGSFANNKVNKSQERHNTPMNLVNDVMEDLRKSDDSIQTNLVEQFIASTTNLPDFNKIHEYEADSALIQYEKTSVNSDKESLLDANENNQQTRYRNLTRRTTYDSYAPNEEAIGNNAMTIPSVPKYPPNKRRYSYGQYQKGYSNQTNDDENYQYQNDNYENYDDYPNHQYENYQNYGYENYPDPNYQYENENYQNHDDENYQNYDDYDPNYEDDDGLEKYKYQPASYYGQYQVPKLGMNPNEYLKITEDDFIDDNNWEGNSSDDIITNAADLMEQINRTTHGMQYPEDDDDENYEENNYKSNMENKNGKYEISPRRQKIITPIHNGNEDLLEQNNHPKQAYSISVFQPQHQEQEQPRKVLYDPTGVPPPDPHESPLYRVISNYKAPSRHRARVSRHTLMRMMYPSRKKQRTPLSPILGKGRLQKSDPRPIMDLKMMKQIVMQNRTKRLRESNINQPQTFAKMFKIIKPNPQNSSKKF